jgi:hypothetical protein
MPPDWNIVDDTPAEPDDTADSQADDRLDARRIRVVVLERRAAYRRKLWTIARALFCLVVTAAVVPSVVGGSRVSVRVLGGVAVVLLLWRAWVEFRSWRSTPRGVVPA